MVLVPIQDSVDRHVQTADESVTDRVPVPKLDFDVLVSKWILDWDLDLTVPGELSLLHVDPGRFDTLAIVSHFDVGVYSAITEEVAVHVREVLSYEEPHHDLLVGDFDGWRDERLLDLKLLVRGQLELDCLVSRTLDLDAEGYEARDFGGIARVGVTQ